MKEADTGAWQARIARALALADARPAVAEALRFYAALARVQQGVVQRMPGSSGGKLGPALLTLLPDFVDAIGRAAPPPLAAALQSIRIDKGWGALIDEYWTSGGREPRDEDELRLFVVEAFLQPYAEQIASEPTPASPTSPPSPTSLACPRCTGLPLIAVLREAGHGAKRSLLCGLCLTEWPSMRLVCTACGESQFEKLPVFRADEYDALRVDACESCRTYIKTIDLTRDGAAVPVVDDLASLPLDLWARERGYIRARPNILRL